MVWPSQSPKINIIENCRHRIKGNIQNHAGDITRRPALRYHTLYIAKLHYGMHSKCKKTDEQTDGWTMDHS